ncbi:unnamed protein product [Kluyveromyces dobzhanskii CBS 2104]|uniref:WGS project CCBQ000000000 data, contig 00015 n=1 Tax=Kluyveromyces dobzhanskii CBS 2104 TaxID=1427455 RepID=A0A0A8LBU1_9SACH|nr:unnamed protein product [Kluyveromyces dobzhanskii CBS 2104]
MEQEAKEFNSVEAAGDIESNNSITGPTTKLTKESLEKIASDSDPINLNAVAYSKKSKSGSPPRFNNLEYEDNSTSGLSKVTSPEHPNSVSLSDIYVSSDAETEKMDLEEDESRVKLSAMVSASIQRNSIDNGNGEVNGNNNEESELVKQEPFNDGTESHIQESAPKLAESSKISDSAVHETASNSNSVESKPDPVPHVTETHESTAETVPVEQTDQSVSNEEVLTSNETPIEENTTGNELRTETAVAEQKDDKIESPPREADVVNKHKLEEEELSDNRPVPIKTEQVFKKPKLPIETKPDQFDEEHDTHENGDHDGDVDTDAEAEDDGALESEVEDNNEDEEEELQPEVEEEEEEAGNGDENKKRASTLDDDSMENGLSPMEKEKLRQDALTELTNIEVEFAQLRQSLYENKLHKLQSELQMCLDGSHPQLQTYYQKIDSIRDFKLKRMYQRQKYELECIDKETRATRTFIHQDFLRKVSDLKHRLLGDTTQKWYDINKERREMDVVVPEVNYHVPIKIANKSLSCITGYAAPANLRRPGDLLSEDLLCENINFRYHNNPVDKLEVIVDRMRFNNELSDLDGLKKFYGGFPGAPELGGLKDSEIHEDLTGIQHH